MTLRSWRGCAVLAAAAALAVPAGGAGGNGALAAEIADNAFVVDEGQGALVIVGVTCPRGSEVLEAFVYVVQDGFTSDFASIPVVCKGRARAYEVRVSAAEQPFHEGRARVSAYVLLTTDESVSPTTVLRLR